jgi:hypothetical protein
VKMTPVRPRSRIICCAAGISFALIALAIDLVYCGPGWGKGCDG